MKLAEIRAETAILEQKMAVLRRLVPLRFEAELIENRLQALAKASEMKPLEFKRVEATERVRLAGGGGTPYERFFVDVAGQDRYTSVGFFLDRVGRLPALVELETLSVDAGPSGTVRFSARLAFPVDTGWPEAPPSALPAPPPPLRTHATFDDERSALQHSLDEHGAFLRRVADAAREPLRRMHEEVSAIDQLRKEGAPARFSAALARVEAGVDGRMVAFGRARFGARTVIEGAVVGVPARAALRPAFENAGFVIETLEVASAGECRALRAGGTRPAPRLAESGEQKVSLSFKDGVLLDVVRLFQEISGRKVWTSPVADGRVTIFATEVPWDVALHGIAASVGMTAVIEGERLFVGPADMAMAPWKSGAVEVFRAKTADGDSAWGRVVELRKLSPEDLTPVGLARTADGMKGVAYGPGRVLWVLAKGVELFEARVDAVDATGVTFAAKDGRRTAVRFAP